MNGDAKWPIVHKAGGEFVPSWPTRIPDAEHARRCTALTDTFDTVRFPGTGELPISLFFEDGMSVVHEIVVERAQCSQLQILIPVPLGVVSHVRNSYRCLIWQGTDLKERTLIDSRSTLAVCTFSYTSSSVRASASASCQSGVVAAIAHTHGIRVHVQTYCADRGEGIDAWTLSAWADVLGSSEVPAADQEAWADTADAVLRRRSSLDETVDAAVSVRRRRVDGVSSTNVHLALLLTQFCWGSAAVVNKLGLTGIGINPLLFALVREITAAPLLLLVLASIRGQLCPWSGFSPASPLVDDAVTRRLAPRKPPGSPVRGARSCSSSDEANSPERKISLGSEELSCEGDSPRRAPRARSMRKLALRFVPGVFIFVDQFCSLTGVKLASATSLAAWQPSQVMFTLSISVCIGAETLTWRKAAGLLFVVGGAACLVLLGGQNAGPAGLSPRLGQLLFFANCMAASLEVIFWRNLLQHSRSPFGHMAVMAESYLMAATLMSVACIAVSQCPAMVELICPECGGDAWHLPSEALWAVGYSVVFQTIVGYCAQAWALRYAESSLVALYATTQPIFATAISCALLLLGINPNGALTWPGPELGGAALIVVGLLVTVPSGLHGCPGPLRGVVGRWRRRGLVSFEQSAAPFIGEGGGTDGVRSCDGCR